MVTYNNLIHKNTKHTPNEVFYSNSQDLLNEVKNNKIENFKYIMNFDYNFEFNENSFLKNNFIIVNQRDKNDNLYMVKNKNKKINLFYKICCKINEVLGGGNYLIEILNNYKDYNIYAGNKFNISIDLLKKCDIVTFGNIMKLNNLDKISYLSIINNEYESKLSESGEEEEDDTKLDNFNKNNKNDLLNNQLFISNSI